MVTPSPTRPEGTPNRWRSRVTLLLALAILIPSCWGFGSKFFEFIAIYRGEVDGAFAVAPILNYLLASSGFLLLFFWASMNGMFHDIERPKYTMLENEQRLDSQPSGPGGMHHGR
jgi:nitrogen fixation-related uncharacterized protein